MHVASPVRPKPTRPRPSLIAFRDKDWVPSKVEVPINSVVRLQRQCALPHPNLKAPKSMARPLSYLVSYRAPCCHVTLAWAQSAPTGWLTKTKHETVLVRRHTKQSRCDSVLQGVEPSLKLMHLWYAHRKSDGKSGKTAYRWK